MNYTNLCDEPADHALGRSRGGLTTKIHQLCDGRGLPLVVLIGPGHAHDSPMFDPLMGQLRVPRVGPGRPRTRPAAVLGDKAYCLARAPGTSARPGYLRGHPRTVHPSRSPPTPRQQRRSPGRLGCPEIQAPQRHRTILQHRQELARPGHPLRQARPHLPCRSSPRRHLRMATTFKRHALVVEQAGFRFLAVGGFTDDSNEAWSAKADNTYTISGRMPPDDGQTAAHQFKIEVTCSQVEEFRPGPRRIPRIPRA